MIDGLEELTLTGTPPGRPYIVLGEIDKEHKICVTNSRKAPKVHIHWRTIKRFKERVREITARRRGRSIYQVIRELNVFMGGWWNYYRITESYNRLRPAAH